MSDLPNQPAADTQTMDINQIMSLLPHRYPFLLIDRLIEIEPRKRVVALKNVTINEPHFAGHFPNFPIMPGVLIIEAIAQAGAALLLTHSHDNSNLREETLAELSHTPMAVLGVMAGWSRWLELRLPSEDRSVPSWIWPVCFVLIGAGLLNYREF